MGRSRSRSRLGLKIKCLGLVSYHRVSFTSQYAQLFASLQNCTYVVLTANHLYRLLIYKSKQLTVCSTQNVGRQQSILQHVTLMPDVYQVCHSIGHCVNKKAASADRTARRQFQATGQPVSRTQASDAMTSWLCCRAMRRSVCNAGASNGGRSLCVQISREQSYPLPIY